MSHPRWWIAGLAALALSGMSAPAGAQPPAHHRAPPRHRAPPHHRAPPLAYPLALAYSAALGYPPAPPATDSLMPFRVDVSRYPEIGVVVTATGTTSTLTSDDFTVETGGKSQHPTARALSPNDVQLVFSPDVHVTATELALERAAAAGFLAGLPAGAESAVASLAPLTTDPTQSVSAALSLARGPRQPAAQRLAAALSAFSSGASVRRTVVLVVTTNERLSQRLSRRFAQQLAASGTALYVLDASPDGAPAFASLAAASGGFVVRVHTSDDWVGALRRVTADLNQQYYLRFDDYGPLPGSARIVAHTPAGLITGVASLPVANPTAPALPAPARSSKPTPGLPFALLALAAVAFVIAYGLAMLAASRREPRPRRTRGTKPEAGGEAGSLDPNDLFFLFVLPCLNEEKVIRNSLQRLLSFSGENFGVIVVDDGSDDDTAEAVSSMADHRVWLLRRTLPNARQGKGEALNFAIEQLTESSWLQGRDTDNVIVVVVDADGRVDPHSLTAVTPYFADPTVGAVQIGVRINNRQMSRLARMQDMEFVIYTEVFQRGRRHLGSVGLGGNGQFMRLSALRSLGDAPWSRSLTEDLDLGIRLLTAGWRNEYCHTAAVHQQGVLELRRLIRQRSRWFQGHLQSWKLIPTIIRGAPRRARADLLYHLSSPAILLIASVLTASFICSLFGSAVVTADGGDPLGMWIPSTYLLAFGPALLYGYIYWLRERDSGVSLTRTAGLAHLYVCYCLMWYAAGWWAVGRSVRRRTNWSKTDRVAEAPQLSGAVAAPLLSPPTRVPVPLVAASDQPLLETRRRTTDRLLRFGGRDGVAPMALTADRGDSVAPMALTADRAVQGLHEPVRSHPNVPTNAPAAPPPPRKRARRPRPRTVALAAAAAAIVAGAVFVTVRPSEQLQGTRWYQVFGGYGHTTVSGSGANAAITLSVATTHSRQVTHAALVVTRTWYHDFLATARVQTERQLRGGAAGAPNPWEVGWVVWHYSSPQHFYALTLESNGWLLSKQDPAYPGGERFLASGKLPRFPVGATHGVGVVQVGNQITVSAGGRLLTRFVDTQRPYLSGAFGIYTEDSVARFSEIHLRALPAAASRAAAITPPGTVSP
jgi:1,2-diacylglycerol 3-beta-glucosyltransferase